MTASVHFDSDPIGVMHAPDLYRHDAVCTPYAGWDACANAAERYAADGYFAVADAFSVDEVAAAKAGLRDLIDGKYPDFTGVSFEAASKERFAELTSDEREDAVRKLMYFTGAEPRLNAIAQHPRLLALVTKLLGKPPKMFQDMALLKPPRIGREKPWHQDHAYFDLPLGTPVVGVWIALDAATLDNGCMRLIHGGHRAGPQPHFRRRDWQICDTQIPSHGVVACPLPPGGALLFDGLVPHGTPHNTSPARRRAVQFHYAPADAVKCPTEERLKIFGGEGRGVEC